MQYSLGKRGRSPVWDQLHPICWILQVTSDTFFENESLMLETYFTFGPLSKTSFFVTKTGTKNFNDLLPIFLHRYIRHIRNIMKLCWTFTAKAISVEYHPFVHLPTPSRRHKISWLLFFSFCFWFSRNIPVLLKIIKSVHHSNQYQKKEVVCWKLLVMGRGQRMHLSKCS